MKKRRNPKQWKRFGLDSLLSAGILLLAVLLCLLIRLWDSGDVYVAMIFVLAVVLISHGTTGYFHGIAASVVAIVCVNFLFTYPYFAFNFTLSGYPVTFFTMLIVSVLTSALTTRIKSHEKLRADAEKEKLRGNLLRAVSHDLRTPLTSILGATSTVLDNDDRIEPEKRRQLLREVHEDAEWLLRVVENLLSITRIGEAPAQIQKQPEAVEEIVAEAVHKFKKRYGHTPLRVQVPPALLMAPMDAILIEQVLINLLENAALHAHADQVELSVWQRGDAAVFEVADNGVGIDESVFPHLFDGQLHAAGNDRTKNMGIGLSVCMSIIKAHGGAMEAENRPVGGAAFRFTLPMEEAFPHA